jgi:ketosteroid isomerase-like protein
MSQQNVEIVRAGFEAGNRRDVEGFLSYVGPEFELRSAIISGAEGKVYRGHDGARRWIADSEETFEEVRFEVSEFRDLGDRVLALGRVRARGRESGVELDSPTGWLCTVLAGKVVRVDGFLSREDALEAAGRSD